MRDCRSLCVGCPSRPSIGRVRLPRTPVQGLGPLVAVGATGDRDATDIAGSRPYLVYVHDLAVLLDLDVATALLGEDALRSGHCIRPARKHDNCLAAAWNADGPAAALSRADNALLLRDRGLAHGDRGTREGQEHASPL